MPENKEICGKENDIGLLEMEARYKAAEEKMKGHKIEKAHNNWLLGVKKGKYVTFKISEQGRATQNEKPGQGLCIKVTGVKVEKVAQGRKTFDQVKEISNIFDVGLATSKLLKKPAETKHNDRLKDKTTEELNSRKRKLKGQLLEKNFYLKEWDEKKKEWGDNFPLQGQYDEMKRTVEALKAEIKAIEDTVETRNKTKLKELPGSKKIKPELANDKWDKASLKHMLSLAEREKLNLQTRKTRQEESLEANKRGSTNSFMVEKAKEEIAKTESQIKEYDLLIRAIRAF